MEQVLHIVERKREANVKHHGQEDELGAGAEVAKELCLLITGA